MIKTFEYLNFFVAGNVRAPQWTGQARMGDAMTAMKTNSKYMKTNIHTKPRHV